MVISRKTDQLFYCIIEQPEMEWQFIDGSIVKAHQHSSGAIQGKETAIGKSRGGNTSKIHLAVDSFGWPVHFKVTGGLKFMIVKLPQVLSKSYQNLII